MPFTPDATPVMYKRLEGSVGVDARAAAADPLADQDPFFDAEAKSLDLAEAMQAARSDRLGSIIKTQLEIAATDLDVAAVMQLICERTQELTKADSATILVVDGDGLVIRAATGFMKEHVGHKVPIEGPFLVGFTVTTNRSSWRIRRTIPGPACSPDSWA